MRFEVQNVTTYHGRILAIHSINLYVEKGEIVSIIGANGAGKSTLLGTIAGMYKSSDGKVILTNQNITNLPDYKVIRKGISLVPEGRQIFSGLTVKENLILGMYTKYNKEKGQIKFKIDTMLGMFPALKKHLNQIAGNLSGGEQQMLAIARALMSDPKVILLDEPSMGLAPLIVKEILEILNKIRDELGTMVVLVEQNVKAALKVANRAYVMDRGEIVLEGNAEKLLYDSFIQSTYLGQGREEKDAIWG